MFAPPPLLPFPTAGPAGPAAPLPTGPGPPTRRPPPVTAARGNHVGQRHVPRNSAPPTREQHRLHRGAERCRAQAVDPGTPRGLGVSEKARHGPSAAVRVASRSRHGNGRRVDRVGRPQKHPHGLDVAPIARQVERGIIVRSREPRRHAGARETPYPRIVVGGAAGGAQFPHDVHVVVVGREAQCRITKGAGGKVAHIVVLQ